MKKLLLLLGMIGAVHVANAQLNETFEGTAFPPTGWSVQSGTSSPAAYRWKSSTVTPINGTKSAFVEYNPNPAASPAPQMEYLITPSLTLPAGSPALTFKTRLSYYWAVDPNDNYDFRVSVSTNGGISYTAIWDETQLGVFTSFATMNVTVPLTAYAGMSNVKIRFEYDGADGANLSLDDVKVVSCVVPSQFVYTATPTLTSASFGWTGPVNAAGYEIQYGVTGFTVGSGSTASATTNQVTLNNLTPSTVYDFYIRTNCGGTNNYSDWVGPISFATQFNPATPPYTTGFEAGELDFIGWSRLNVNATGGSWQLFQADEEFPAQDGTVYASVSGAGAASDAWLFSRGLNLVENTPVTVSYYLRKFNGAGTASVNNLTVKAGTSTTAAGMTITVNNHPNYAPTNLTLQTATFTPPTSGVYYIGFNYTAPAQTAANNGGLDLDAVSVTGTAGVDEAFASKLSVFPNPATNVINVSNADALVNGVSFTDLNGRTVKTVKFDGVSEAQINIADLSAGMYLMNIVSDKGSVTKKIVKQ